MPGAIGRCQVPQDGAMCHRTVPGTTGRCQGPQDGATARPRWIRPWDGPTWAGPIILWARPIWARPIILWAWSGPYGPGPYGPAHMGQAQQVSVLEKYDLSIMRFMKCYLILERFGVRLLRMRASQVSRNQIGCPPAPNLISERFNVRLLRMRVSQVSRNQILCPLAPKFDFGTF